MTCTNESDINVKEDKKKYNYVLLNAMPRTRQAHRLTLNLKRTYPYYDSWVNGGANSYY